jgi:hypothetical protein
MIRVQREDQLGMTYGEKNRPITSARTAYSGYPLGSFFPVVLFMLRVIRDRVRNVSGELI